MNKEASEIKSNEVPTSTNTGTNKVNEDIDTSSQRTVPKLSFFRRLKRHLFALRKVKATSISYNDEATRKKLDKINERIQKLKNNKKIKYPNDTLQTYFYYLSETHHTQIDFDFVRNVLKGIDINYTNEYGDNALHEACKLNNLEVVILLIKNNINLHHHNIFGQTAVHIAASRDNVKVLEYFFSLKEGKSLLESTTIGELQTPLHYAAKYGSLKSLSSLVKTFEANLEAKDFQDRTPFFLAAEYGIDAAANLLLDLKCNSNVVNIFGQKALYWIIAKCPELANRVLDTFEKTESLSKTVYHELHPIDVEPFEYESGVKKIPYNHSILNYIVENQLLEVITHPVIESLIKAKWADFGRFKCYMDMLFTIIYLVIWHLLAALTPFEERYKYNLPQDWWRIFLFIIAIATIAYIIINESIDARNIYKNREKANKLRLQELENLQRYCHPLDQTQKMYIEQEKHAIGKISILSSYFEDSWNWFDIVSILMLLSVLFTRLADILNHSDELSKDNARLFAFTVIVISFRLFQSGRVLFERFGILVVTATLLIRNIIVWFLVFVVFWVPFEYESTFDTNCMDINNLKSNSCEIIEIPNFQRLSDTFYFFWMAVFGRSNQLALMNEIDPIMTDFLISFFIVIHLLLLVNIFIALLNTTASRVQSAAKAFFLLQRAVLVTSFENRMGIKRRLKHLQNLHKKFKIDEDRSTSDINDASLMNELSESFDQLKQNVNDAKEQIEKFEKREDLYEFIVESTENDNFPLNGIDKSNFYKLDVIESEMESYKKILLSRIKRYN